YLNQTVNLTITVTTRVRALNIDPPITISESTIYPLLIEDLAPPRVINVLYYWDDDMNPTNITFIAEIEENWSDIEEVILFYYFRSIKDGEVTEEPIAAKLTNLRSSHFGDMHVLAFLQTEALDSLFQNTTMQPLNDTHWVTSVGFNPKSDVEIIFQIFVADSLGNVNPSAYPIGLDPVGRPSFKAQTGVDPEFVQMIIIVGSIAFILVIVFSAVAIKKWRATELVGLDKERVIDNLINVSDVEVLASLDFHTLGIVVAFFDQRHGPIPIIVIPELLKDNYEKLVELADHSFSTTQFVDNFEDVLISTFDFILGRGARTNSMSFGFALDRPQARGGAENITLNLLIQPNMFELIEQFKDQLLPKVQEIHQLMNRSPHEKEKVMEEITRLRKHVSYIVLSYEQLYGTTELILEEDTL
ncbi:MAG: hypothetical protein ACFFDT_20055, partial [Candidatus Hodarchaeota archaeon]